ncbi:MAG: hypothetical protein IJV01_00870 [Bacteroidales bacterium]|nr:hypothetical protein [Bacteroidales bacterium]
MKQQHPFREAEYSAPACEAVELLAANILCLSPGADTEGYGESDIHDLF